MRKVQFEPVITLGNLLSLLSIVVTFCGFAVYNERRMTQYEQTMKFYEYRLQKVESAHAVSKLELPKGKL